MNQTVFIVLGLVAAAATVSVVWGGRNSQMTSEQGVIGGLFGLALWGVFVINSYNVEVITTSGDVVVNSYQSLAALGLAAAGLCIYATVQALIVQLNKEDTY